MDLIPSRVTAVAQKWRTNGCLAVLWLVDAALCFVILKIVPYTEIDWNAYMQQISTIIDSQEYDYRKIEGDTGPLVYPAGHVLIFGLLRTLTNMGSNIMAAQLIFAFIYLFQLGVILDIFRRSRHASLATCAAMICSKRLHSIYLLRCFNDGVAMCFFWIAVWFMTHNRWKRACIMFSLSVSVKMSTLLYAPGLLFLLHRKSGGNWRTVCGYIALCAVPQILLGAPFLLRHPFSYIHRAFELTRVFTHRWSVNWAFLPEEVFVSRHLAVSLLVGHLTALLLLWRFVWIRRTKGTSRQCSSASPERMIEKKDDNFLVLDSTLETQSDLILLVLASSCTAGMAFARSLHYQFYSWYFHGTVWSLMQTEMGFLLKLIVLLPWELVWNIYPPTPMGSAGLHVAHLVFLASYFFHK